MSVNNVDIKIVTDYTAFTNTVRFQVAAPLSADDAKTIYEDLAGGDLAKTQTDITAAVKKTAPAQIQTLIATLLAAYNGAPVSGGGTDSGGAGGGDAGGGTAGGGG